LTFPKKETRTNTCTTDLFTLTHLHFPQKWLFLAGNFLGGKIDISGGASRGVRPSDHGGNVNFTGGGAAAGRGGSLSMSSGVGAGTSSGLVTLASAAAGTAGTSGEVAVRSGEASLGNSGDLLLATGSAGAGGAAGAIRIAVRLTPLRSAQKEPSFQPL
jgi:hypothetical protein